MVAKNETKRTLLSDSNVFITGIVVVFGTLRLQSYGDYCQLYNMLISSDNVCNVLVKSTFQMFLCFLLRGKLGCICHWML